MKDFPGERYQDSVQGKHQRGKLNESADAMYSTIRYAYTYTYICIPLPDYATRTPHLTQFFLRM